MWSAEADFRARGGRSSGCGACHPRLGGDRPQQGFTLLELLVALAVFALVSVMAYVGLRAVLEAHQLTEVAAGRLSELQVAMTLLSRDLEQLVERPVRDVYGDPQAPLRYSPYRTPPRLEMVRSGARLSGKRSSLQLVAWELREGALQRLSWDVLDGADDEPDTRMDVILPKEAQRLKSFEVRFHVAAALGSTSSESWPPEVITEEPAGLPLAVEVTLELEGIGAVSRLFAVR